MANLPFGFYRIEFQEKTQNFHLDDGNHEPNTNGYMMIADKIEDGTATLFCSLMEEKYDLPNQPKNPFGVKITSKLTVKKVREEWEYFNKVLEGIVKIKNPIDKMHKEHLEADNQPFTINLNKL